MGKRGRPPKPTKLRIVDGDRESRINYDEPVPGTTPLVCPDDVSAEVRNIWDYTASELAAMGLAAGADRDNLRAYCEAVVSHRRACKVLAQSSVLIKGLHGGMVRNPALQVQRDAAATMRGFAQEFGLTPSARSSIVIGDSSGRSDAEANPFAGAG